MRRRPLALTAGSLAIVACLLLGVSGPPARANAQTGAQAGAPFCQPGQAPAFVFGIAALSARLGETMGSPLECEHLDADSGDTVQHTTTGLAYYRPALNAAIFTDGSSHWALADGSLVRWQGSSVTPPQPTDAEAAYLRAITPLRARAATLQSRLAGIRQQVDRGQIESLDVAGLRSLADELRAARDAYAAARGAGRLWQYHGMMVVSLNEGMGAAELLTQARQVTAPELRARLVAGAARHRQESERLQAAPADAYGRALPVVVQ